MAETAERGPTAWQIGALALVVLLAPGAVAASHLWQAAPASCMPDDANHGPAGVTHWAANTDGSVGFLGNETGSIVLRCNITNPNDDGSNPNWNSAEVSLVDTSSSNANYVQVGLRRVNKFTGAIGTEVLVNSNDYDPTGTGWVYVSEAVGTVWDFENFVYFLEIQLARTTASPTEKLLFVGFF